MDSGCGYAFSALHVAPNEKLLQYVRHKDVRKATSALVNGADPNIQDTETGDAALHIAVSVRSQVLVRLLIVFDADLALKNKKQETALDLARKERADDIAQDIEKIVDLQNELDTDQPRKEQLPQQAADESEEILLLSLDGGGIRGLVLMQVVLEMEKRRKKLYPESATLLSRFNWIAGNSTGGMAALALAANPQYNALQGRRMYFDLKDEVLGSAPPIPNETVDKVFKNVYGESKTMNNIKKWNVTIMTTLADQSPPILHIMSNYGGARNGQLPPEEQLVWKAARATSSVPFFFHPQDGKYLDGGLIANNPTLDAVIDLLGHAEKENRKVKLKLVLSLGTGLVKPDPIEDIDFDTSHDVVGKFFLHSLDFLHKHKIGELANDAALVLHNHKACWHLVQVISAQITQPDGEVIKRGEFLCKTVGARYFRINPRIDDVSFLSNDDTKLINMLYQVVYYMLKNCRELTDPVLNSIY